MFSVGEYIVYGVEGVCRVEEAGKLKVAGLDKNRAYYRLRPYYHDGTIYTPVDGKAVMRPVLTREELERLLPRLPELEPLGDVPPDSRAAGEYYRAILSGHDCVALLRLCNGINTRCITSDSVKLIGNRQHLLSVTAEVSNQPFKQAGGLTQILLIALSRFTPGSINRNFLLTKVACRCHQRISSLEL